jgi:hypothetical protein
VIDHSQVRELLELAAVEPGGLDRLAAGDTAESAAAAGHLAGCASCMEEARRLAAVGPVLRDAVASVPPDELRARTLALVKAVGRERPIPVASGAVASAGATALTTATERDKPDGMPAMPVAIAGRARRRPRWPTLAAAAIIIALVAGGGLFAVVSAGQLQTQAANLAELNQATLDLTAQPDAVRVALIGVADPTAAPGTLLFSPGTQELVVSAPSLTEPARGQWFACWMTRPDGSRVRLGWMEFGGGLAYWAGWSEELAKAGPGTTFGVTLVGDDGKPVAPGDVLKGTVTTS